MAATALEVRQLARRFGRITAVEELDFTVREGELFGLLGRSTPASMRATPRCSA